jgi:hypothetical protein
MNCLGETDENDMKYINKFNLNDSFSFIITFLSFYKI